MEAFDAYFLKIWSSYKHKSEKSNHSVILLNLASKPQEQSLLWSQWMAAASWSLYEELAETNEIIITRASFGNKDHCSNAELGLDPDESGYK